MIFDIHKKSHHALLTGLALVLSLMGARGEVVLNEIYSHDSAGGYRAADGGHYDWIELHNSSDIEIDLQGHYLTDVQWNPTKWEFQRSFIVPAGGYRIVFASDLDDLVMEQEHLNFKLSSNGEYLGLIAPDGTTVIDQFAPAYPNTDNRVTYGRPENTGAPFLLSEPTPGLKNSARPLLPSIEQFDITPDPAFEGALVTVSWNTLNTEETTINDFAVDSESGSFQFRGLRSKNYKLVTSSRYGTDSREIAFEVLDAPLSFTARPTTLASGGMSVIRWHTPSAEYADTVTLNGESYLHRNRRTIVHPTNETIMPATGNWRSYPSYYSEDWTEPDFDDGNWLTANDTTGSGYFRREFDIPNLDGLSSAIVRVQNSAFNYSGPIWLNGVELSKLPDSDSSDLSQSNWIIPMNILLPQGNLLAFRVGINNSNPEATFEIEAWREQHTETIYPLTLEREVNGEMISETIDLTILPGNAQLPPQPSLALSEFYGGDFGDASNSALQYVELANRSDRTINLEGVQLAGMLYHDFHQGRGSFLDPSKFGLIVRDRLIFDAIFGSDLPILDLSEDPPLSKYEGPNGKPLLLLDSFGALIEVTPPLRYPFFFTIQGQRNDFEKPAYEYESWQSGFSIGEDILEIEEFTISPEVAQHGDWVTFSWKVSRPADLHISDGVGNVSGTEGSIKVQLDNNRDFHSYRLTARSDLLTRDKWATVTTPPVIRYFESSARVIEPYQAVTLSWGWILDSVSLSSEPGLRLDYTKEFKFIAGASGFGLGDRWSYLSSDREFQPAWKEMAYPPGRWSSAETTIGVNRLGTRHLLVTNPTEQSASYFRKNFTLENIGDIERLFIDILAEDGAAIFINGTEALRTNLPEGVISKTTQALSDRSTADLIYEEFEIDTSLLLEGDNVIAVSLHLFHEGGDLPVDQAFDLALRAERTLPEDGRLHYTLSSENEAGRDTAKLTLIIGETKTLEEWQLDHSLIGEDSLADTDNDGISNLLEFVTGTDPTSRNSLPLSVTWTPSRQLEISYQQELAAIGYQLQVEESDDAVNWSKLNNSGGFYYLDDHIPESSTLALRKHRSISTAPSGPKFFRLRVFKEEP